ncbi:MAG: hypothetical protein FWF84_02805, partial [Kiritimatiellaeota bacterium]|nr:hypothetical protein [Kiritimatiellota bacterium]
NMAGYVVDGVGTAAFAPSASFQLVAVRFGATVNVGDVYVGGSVPSPAWKRNWRGEAGEILVFPFEPSPEEENALRHYVAVKWGVCVPHVPTTATPHILRAIGVSTDAYFNTLIIVR